MIIISRGYGNEVRERERENNIYICLLLLEYNISFILFYNNIRSAVLFLEGSIILKWTFVNFVFKH